MEYGPQLKVKEKQLINKETRIKEFENKTPGNPGKMCDKCDFISDEKTKIYKHRKRIYVNT